MIQFFRDKLTSYIVKGLLLLIAIAFVISGAQSRSSNTGGRTATVATVGDTKIEAQDFSQNLQRIERMMQGRANVEDIRPQLVQTTLNTLINEKLYIQLAKDNALTLATPTLQQEIAATPAFQDEQGKFDKKRYQMTLDNLQMRESTLLEQMKNDLTRRYFNNLFNNAPAAPTSLQTVLSAYLKEQRQIDYALIPFPAVSTTAPSEADIKAYYAKNAAQFMTEEQRKIQYVIINPAIIAKDIAINKADAEKFYTAHAEDFSIPEKRTVEQLLFAEENDAKQANVLAKEGKTLKEIATKITAAKYTQLGTVTQKEVLKDVGDAAFALPLHKVSSVVQSPLGYHLLSVTAQTAGKVTSFQEAEKEIVQNLQLAQALEKSYALGTSLEDKIYQGTSLASAAAEAKLPLEKIHNITFSAQNTAPLLQENPQVLEQIFKLAPNKNTGLLDLKNNQMALLHLESVTPAAPEPLEKVRVRVTAALIKDKAETATQAKAKDIAGMVEKGSSFKDAVAKEHLSMSTTDFLARGQTLPALPDTLLRQAFSFSKGKVLNATTEKGVLVAVVAGIKTVSSAEKEADTQALDAALKNAIGGDTREQFEQALRLQYPVKINQDILIQFIQKPKASE